MNKKQQIKYRDHRGSLKESVATTQYFDIAEDIIDFINSQAVIRPVEEIKTVRGVFDHRVNEKVYLLVTRSEGETEFFPYGWTNKPVEPTTIPK